jgi:serine/threonine protein kinase
VGEDFGQRFIIMEFVEGQSLKDVLVKENFLETKKGLSIFSQMLEGLGSAHKKQILHRDIKPDNVFISSAGTAKLGDFGLAKSLNASSFTQTGTIMGTPYYMSPEQAQGQNADAVSDLYSMGATLFHMLLGKPPFDGDSPMSILYRQIHDPLAFPKDSKLHPSVKQLIQKMMAKEKWRRPKSCEEVLSQIQDALKLIEQEPASGAASKESSRMKPPSASPAVAPISSSSTVMKKTTSIHVSPKSRLPVFAGVFFLLALSIAMGMYSMDFFASNPIPPEPHKKPVSTASYSNTFIPSSTTPEKLKPAQKQNDPDSAPEAVFSELRDLEQSKQYKKALELIQKNLQLYPKDALLKEQQKIFLGLENARLLKERFNLQDKDPEVTTHTSPEKSPAHAASENPSSTKAPENFLKKLEAACDDPDDQIKKQVLEELEHSSWRNENFIPILIRLSRDKTPEIRIKAVKLLALQGQNINYNSYIADTLSNLLNLAKADSFARKEVFEAFKILHKHSAPTLVNLLNSDNINVSGAARYALVDIGPYYAIHVVEAFTYESKYVNQLAKDILIDLARKDKLKVISAVKQGMNRNSDDRMQYYGKCVLKEIENFR